MKKCLMIFIICLLLNPPSGNSAHALEQKLYFPLIFKNNCRQGLVYSGFGDSITSCYYDSNIGDFPFCGYLRGIFDRLVSKFEANFIFFNNGIGGETTSGGLIRFEKTLNNPEVYCVNPNHPDQLGGCNYPSDTSQPLLDLVIIMEGINDLSNNNITYDSIEANLRGMIQLAGKYNKRVILATITPVAEAVYYQRIAEFNSRIRQIGMDYQIPVADIFSAFTAIPNWAIVLLAQDGFHPNHQGNGVMADVVFQTIISYILPGSCYFN